MDFDIGQEPARVRTERRELVKDKVPQDFLGAFTDDPADLQTAQRFCRQLAERGLSWPKEFGDGGTSVWEQTAVREEMWAHHEPRGAQYMGVNCMGPIIMRHGLHRSLSGSPAGHRKRLAQRCLSLLKEF